MALRAFCLLGLVTSCAAVVIEVKDVPLPGPWSLEVVKILYLTAESEVNFEGFELSLDGVAKRGLVGVSVGIAPWGAVAELFTPDALCDATGSVTIAAKPSKDEVLSLRLDAARPTSFKGVARKDGPFGLFYVNCGENVGKISGTVSATDLWGRHYAGHEQLMLPVCAFSTLCFMVLALVWLVEMTQNSDRLQNVHLSIGIVALTGFFTIFLECLHYVLVGQVGSDYICMLLSCACAVTTLSMVLQTLFNAADTVLGHGMTWSREFALLVSALGTLPRVSFGTERAEHLVSTTIVLGLTGIAVLLIGCTLLCAVKDLSAAMNKARETNQEGMLSSIQQTCVVMIFLVVVFGFLLTLDIFDRPELPNAWWKYHALLVTAPSHAGLFLGLAYTMYVWSPGGADVIFKVPNDEDENEELVGVPSADKIGAPAE